MENGRSAFGLIGDLLCREAARTLVDLKIGKAGDVFGKMAGEMEA